MLNISLMKELIQKPHLIFLFAIPIILFFGIVNWSTTVDINIHDTYYVIAYFHLSILISLLFGIIGIGYWRMLKTKRELSKWLNLIHITFTFGGLLLIQLFSFLIVELNELSKSDDFVYNIQLEVQIILVAMVIILAQIVYPINILRGLIKKKNKISGRQKT